MARTRTINGPVVSGGVAKASTSALWDIEYPSQSSGWHQCIDSTGPKDIDNPLTIEHSYKILGWCNGQNGAYYFDQNIPYFVGAGGDANPSTSRPSTNSMMTQALAKTAPYVPSWNGSSAVLQLKDFRHLPRQVRDMGEAILEKRKPKALLKAGADWHLLLSFGIAPFLSDLRSLLQFQDRSDRRLKELRAESSSPSGAPRKAYTWSDTSPVVDYGVVYPVSHYFASCRVHIYYYTTRKSWGTVRWSIPPASMPSSGAGSDKALAQRLANGYDISPSTVWDLMPWTWLIDWFSNIDDFIKLSYNVLGASSGRYCIMDHTTTHIHGDHYDGAPIWTPSGNCRHELLLRTPVSLVYPEVHLPFITGGMASILDSLAVQRFVK